MVEPTPADGPRSGARAAGAAIGFTALAGLITATVLVVSSPTPAAAAELETFASCAEIQQWTADAAARGGVLTGTTTAMEDNAGGSDALGAPTAAATDGARTGGGDESQAAGSGSTGDTNTVVEGVDEIDVLDRIGDDRLLVGRNGVLALVDLSGRTVLSEVPGVPYDTRISVAGDLVWVAGSSQDGLGTEITRLRLAGDALVEEGSWTTRGYLLDARRTGDDLHVVVVDTPYDGGIPFDGGPVPCDQVWHPVAPSPMPSATLVVTLPATGDLQPSAAAQVTGSGGNILVTADALYIATDAWVSDPQTGSVDVSTGLHRFDLATLTPTGSGSVPGSLAGRFAIDEHDGFLRVATSLAGGGGGIVPMPVECGPAVDCMVDDVVGVEVGGGDVGVGSGGSDGTASATAVEADAAPVEEQGSDGGAAGKQAPPESETTTTTEPETTTTTEPETTTTTEPETTTTTAPEATTTTAPETTTSTVAPPAGVVASGTGPEDALAEVFVLDTEGTLDLVGQSNRFGHDYETIQGVRFVDDTAYVVTFRQTDPFYVIDLADPAAPQLRGELQIEGFSAYLHPVTDTLVIGFGPNGDGRTSARLFDVTDPSRPTVVDEEVIADDSPVVWDSHALVALDGQRFAVPVNDYPVFVRDECSELPADGGGLVPEPRPIEPGTTEGGAAAVDDVAVGEPVPVDGSTDAGAPTDIDVVADPPVVCNAIFEGGGSGVRVLGVDGTDIVVEQDQVVPLTNDYSTYAERVVQAADGTWFFLAWDRLVAADGSGEIVLPTS